MLEKPIKILHTGDIQIEVRGEHQRYDEFMYIFSQIEEKLQLELPDMYLIAGDIFENWNANDIERMIFQQHLLKVLNIEQIKQIVITYGNHDINQRKTTNFFKHGIEDEATPNALDTIVNAINSDKILLLDSTGYFKVKNIPGLGIVNWSQKAKHSDVLNEPYSPVDIECPDNTLTWLTVYHDPISGCKNWDGKPVKGTQNSKSLDIFNTNTILAGDIHLPQTLTTETKQFIYCGSPVPRNFGEGDYYRDGERYQSSMIKHTIVIEMMDVTGNITNALFVPVKQYRSYSTFELTSNIKPADVCTGVNWVIEYKGIGENKVRVKLPSASESWIALEEKIAKQIISENSDAKNIDITYSYGKAFEEQDDTTVVEDVKRLITTDKIIEVANKYIDDMVASSKTIPSEDKTSVSSEIKKLFEKELHEEDLSNDLISYNVKLLNIKISNFMSLGDNIEVNFNDVSELIKLTGGNGIGKTTFYNALKWILTGYISQSQNRTKKNENNLLVFNDYRWTEDNVKIQLKFLLNNTEYTIVRVVSRTWKKDVEIEQKMSKNWKKYVADTNALLAIKYNDTVLKDDAAQLHLDKIFGGLENLERIVFANQFTLRSFVCSNPVRLCEEVLQHIGMGFFDKMYERYDKVRANHMSGVAKPQENITYYIQEIEKEKEKKEDIKDRIVSLLTDIKDLENKQDTLNNEMLSETSKLIPIPENETSASLMNEYNKKKEEVENKEDKNKRASEIIEAKLKEVDIDLYRDKKKEYEKSVSDTQVKINITSESIHSIEKDILILEQQISSVTSTIKEQYAKKLEELNTTLQEKNTESENISKKIETVKDAIANEEKTLIQEKNTLLQNLEFEISSTQNDISILNSQIAAINITIDELKKSTVCPTCGRMYDEDTLKTIEENIHEKEEDIHNKEYEIQIYKKDLEPLVKQKEHISTLQIGSNKLSDYQHKLQTYVSDKADVSVAIESIKLLINNNKSEVETAISSSKEIFNINQLIHKHNVALNANKLVLNNYNKELENAKKLLDDILKIIEAYDKTDKQKLQLQTIIEATKTDRLQLDLIKEKYEKTIKNEEVNKEIQERIDKLTEQINFLKNTIQTEAVTLNKYNTEIALIDTIIENHNKEIENCIHYRISDATVKMYKVLISKNGLPQHIFSIVRPLINNNLNNLLEDMSFRLAFTEDNRLVMVDLSKPGQPIRTPNQFSGMQTCFTGLALVYVTRMCNNTFIFDSLFIDEVSGQLNSGDELTYKSANYQEQFKCLLRKFTGMKVWIIDHVIDDLDEAHRFEVSPSDDGTHIKQLF